MNSMALIQLQHAYLALPHHNIQAIERCSPEAGTVSIAQQCWTIYTLDKELNFTQTTPDPQPFVVCFKRYCAAIRCHKVDTIEFENITPLPGIMQKNNGCIEGFIVHNNGLVLVVNADSLLQHCPSAIQTNGGGLLCNALPGC